MVVYIDIIFALNFMLDYIISYYTYKASFIPINQKRLLIGSTAGGIYSIFMFEKSISFIYGIFGKLIFSVIIILLTFKVKKIKGFLRIMSNYYIVAFSVCGAVVFINYYFGVVSMKNGLFYIQNNIFLLIPVAIITCSVSLYVIKILNKNSFRKNTKLNVEIYMEDKSVEVTGIMDTGNLLLDPITLYPVMVADYESIKNILPQGLLEFFKSEKDLNTLINRKYMGRIRLIPYKNIGGSSVLKGFKPDKIVIKNDVERIVEDIIVAVSYKKISENNEFSAVLNPQI